MSKILLKFLQILENMANFQINQTMEPMKFYQNCHKNLVSFNKITKYSSLLQTIHIKLRQSLVLLQNFINSNEPMKIQIQGVISVVMVYAKIRRMHGPGQIPSASSFIQYLYQTAVDMIERDDFLMLDDENKTKQLLKRSISDARSSCINLFPENKVFAELENLITAYTWSHPLLLRLVNSESEIDEETGLAYIETVDSPEVLHQRIELLTEIGCVGFAQNLLRWCLRSKVLSRDSLFFLKRIIYLLEANQLDEYYQLCKRVSCCSANDIFKKTKQTDCRQSLLLTVARTFLVMQSMKPVKKHDHCLKNLVSNWIHLEMQCCGNDEETFIAAANKMLSPNDVQILVSYLSCMQNRSSGKVFNEHFANMVLTIIKLERHSLLGMKASNTSNLSETCKVLTVFFRRDPQIKLACLLSYFHLVPSPSALKDIEQHFSSNNDFVWTDGLTPSAAKMNRNLYSQLLSAIDAIRPASFATSLTWKQLSPILNMHLMKNGWKFSEKRSKFYLSKKGNYKKVKLEKNVSNGLSEISIKLEKDADSMQTEDGAVREKPSVKTLFSYRIPNHSQPYAGRSSGTPGLKTEPNNDSENERSESTSEDRTLVSAPETSTWQQEPAIKTEPIEFTEVQSEPGIASGISRDDHENSSELSNCLENHDVMEPSSRKTQDMPVDVDIRQPDLSMAPLNTDEVPSIQSDDDQSSFSRASSVEKNENTPSAENLVTGPSNSVPLETEKRSLLESKAITTDQSRVVSACGDNICEDNCLTLSDDSTKDCLDRGSKYHHSVVAVVVHDDGIVFVTPNKQSSCREAFLGGKDNLTPWIHSTAAYTPTCQQLHDKHGIAKAQGICSDRLKNSDSSFCSDHAIIDEKSGRKERVLLFGTYRRRRFGSYRRLKVLPSVRRPLFKKTIARFIPLKNTKFTSTVMQNRTKISKYSSVEKTKQNYYKTKGFESAKNLVECLEIPRKTCEIPGGCFKMLSKPYDIPSKSLEIPGECSEMLGTFMSRCDQETDFQNNNKKAKLDKLVNHGLRGSKVHRPVNNYLAPDNGQQVKLMKVDNFLTNAKLVFQSGK